jgi:amidohydrolase
MRPTLAAFAIALTLGSAGTVSAQDRMAEDVRAAASAIAPQVIAWRRDLHQNPELGFAETRTAAFVAERLRALGMEVRTGVGKTGVVGVLRGGGGGSRVVALRADMDALPVLEATGLPFASTATGTYQGATVPVAHACGHDAHIAMLLGAAEVLAGMKDRLPGTVVFIFQPAEEGAPPGEPLGGAALMIQEGALENPKVEAIFGLHVVPGKATTPAVVDKIETVVPVVTQHASILSPGATTMAESLVHAQEGDLGPAHREHIYRHVIPGAAQNLAQAQEFMHSFTQKSPQRLIREVAKPK